MEKRSALIPNGITGSRILFSLCLLVLSPTSVLFALLYLLCGVTDVLDGFLARRLHTESMAGQRLDSTADLFFAAAYAIKILPVLRLPVWILIWSALIAALKIAGILIRYKKKRSFSIAHSFSNKLTGLLLFFLPMTVRLSDRAFYAAAVCAAATAAAVKELWTLKGKP